MTQFKFSFPTWREIEPGQWLTQWAELYTRNDNDNDEYFHLIEKTEGLASYDFERIGRWKEGCSKPGHGSWKTGTPKAYDVWMSAKAEKPACPDEGAIAEFLSVWSEKTFVAGKRSDQALIHRFGLSRATTLLHFVSAARYPIFDSRVATALSRLGSPIENTIDGYLNSFCPLFAEIAVDRGVGGIDGLRKLDNALFMLGADTSYPKQQN